ncbi:unnamed protein product, partial [Heligmosomoides polygyrus]|uniref:Transposase n=1 Tax=Heligmosomoides polygyrus TaxID=6339 RepID=A0A183FKN6_HELPZ
KCLQSIAQWFHPATSTSVLRGKKRKRVDESGIRTHAPEGTGALNQRLRPLGHLATSTRAEQVLYEPLFALHTCALQDYWASDETTALMSSGYLPMGWIAPCTRRLHTKAEAFERLCKTELIALNSMQIEAKQLTRVGFEPTPPKGLVPKTSALDRSAISPYRYGEACTSHVGYDAADVYLLTRRRR